MSTDRSQNIRDRVFAFACRIAELSVGLSRQPGTRSIIDQLLKSGTAIGANLEEAKAGSSKREFIRFVEISLRESRETVYWLRLCEFIELGDRSELQDLRGEAEQIGRILGAVVVSAKRRMTAGYVVVAAFAVCILHFALLGS
jgi:four helix bundle protein